MIVEMVSWMLDDDDDDESYLFGMLKPEIASNNILRCRMVSCSIASVW